MAKFRRHADGAPNKSAALWALMEQYPEIESGAELRAKLRQERNLGVCNSLACKIVSDFRKSKRRSIARRNVINASRERGNGANPIAHQPIGELMGLLAAKKLLTEAGSYEAAMVALDTVNTILK